MRGGERNKRRTSRQRSERPSIGFGSLVVSVKTAGRNGGQWCQNDRVSRPKTYQDFTGGLAFPLILVEAVRQDPIFLL